MAYDPHTRARQQGTVPAATGATLTTLLAGCCLWLLALGVGVGLGLWAGPPLGLWFAAVATWRALGPAGAAPDAPAAPPDDTADGAPPGADPGHRVWPLGPVLTDVVAVWRALAQTLAGVRHWSLWPRDLARPTPGTLAFGVPVLLAGAAGVVSAALVAASTAALLTVCLLLVAAVSGGLWAVGAAVLRGAESGARRLLRTRHTCPRPGCHHVSVRPSLRCPGCGRVHHHLRPGVQGLLVRRCRCGATLPTTVRPSAAAGAVVCGRCEKPLQAGPLGRHEVVVALFGARSSGKTRLLGAALAGLGADAAAAGATLAFDTGCDASAQRLVGLVRRGADTAATPATGLPEPVTVTLEGPGRRPALVRLFDASGVQLGRGDAPDRLPYLGGAQALVLVLDPFSVPQVRDGVGPVLREARAATDDPDLAYALVRRLRDRGPAPAGQVLAVVVAKADLLAGTALQPPTASDDIATWLRGVGLGTLVTAAARDFTRVRYFAVASTTRGTDPGLAPQASLRWALAQAGVADLPPVG